MAIACFRLVTFFPLRPLLRVPRLRRRMADFTAFPAPLLYLAMYSSSFTRQPATRANAVLTTPPIDEASCV